jgi:iron-sulfur cluster insertion protein
MITLTQNAVAKIADLLLEENVPGTKLRIFVQGGGCSGFSYGFSFDTDVAEDDTIVEKDNVSIIVDAMSYQYLVGSTVDYKESLMGSSFVLDNPNTQSTCGCGSSFSVADDFEFEDHFSF